MLLFLALLVSFALDARAASIQVVPEPLEIGTSSLVRVYLVLEPGEEAVGFTGTFDIEGPVARDRTPSNYGNTLVQPWVNAAWSIRPDSPHLTIDVSGPYSYTDPQPVEWTSDAGPLLLAGFSLSPSGPEPILFRTAASIYLLDRVGGEDVQVLVAPTGTVVATIPAVPEPATGLLLLPGVLGLLAARRR